MAVHLITVVGGRVTLLPQMLDHYLELGVDSILLYVHLRSSSDEVLDTVRSIAADRGIKVAGQRIGDWLEVQYQILSEERLRYKNDWFVIADQDELQLHTGRLSDLVLECDQQGFDYVQGCFVDRFAKDGTLAVYDPQHPVWTQYPIGALFTYPILGADARKVAVAKGYVPLVNAGHHITNDGVSCPIDRHLIQVHHFKWISGALEYLSARHSKRWPDIDAVTTESRRFAQYYESHGNQIDLSDPLILAAECKALYPNWDVVINHLKKMDIDREPWARP